MDDLMPPLLTAIREIRWHLLAGRPVKIGVIEYLSTHHCEFAVRLNELWARKDQPTHALPPFKGHREQTFWELLLRGDRGEPVLEPLKELEADVEKAAQFDLDAHIGTLPFKALVPLLLFQFPAFIILLVGPLLRELSRHALAAAAALSLLAPSPAAAATLEATAVRRLAGARSAADVQRIERDMRNIRVARLACQIQLREQSIPSACYRALKLENAWNLHGGSGTLRRLTERVDERCAKAGALFRGQAVADLEFLSTRCRHDLARARELWNYRSGAPDNWRGN